VPRAEIYSKATPSKHDHALKGNKVWEKIYVLEKGFIRDYNSPLLPTSGDAPTQNGFYRITTEFTKSLQKILRCQKMIVLYIYFNLFV
jgi:hypothetical protein